MSPIAVALAKAAAEKDARDAKTTPAPPREKQCLRKQSRYRRVRLIG